MMLNKLSLNTIGLNRIGLNRIGKPSRGSSDRPYIDPEVLASLKAVCICYGKSNDDPDRAIVKNLVDPDNPFIISNAAYKLNSGYGKYEITFQYFPYRENVTSVSDSKVVFGIGGQLLIPYSAITENIPSFKIKVNGLSETYHFKYYYRSSDGVQHSVDMAQDGYYELPICYNVQSSSDGTNYGFANNGTDVITITQIPSFEGAFVTDGIDDLITSTKTVQEMLGGSNEITVVSMTACLSSYVSNDSRAFTNYIRNDQEFIRSYVTNSNDSKYGIYGYSISNIDSYNTTAKVINNILGDKEDCKIINSVGTSPEIWNSKFSVVGYLANNGSIVEASQVAWYWTVIANKVLTTDQINQVIAYYNLDRTLKPDILCNTIKQGITNENHAEFGDKLIDFSGNGRDIQLNNIAWKVDSGIGKYATDFTSWINKPTETYHSKSILEAGNVLRTKSAASSMKVKVQFDKEAIGLSFRYFEGGVSKFIYINSNGEYSLPPLEEVGVNDWEGFSNNSSSSVTITQIPSHAGALCLDGVEDYGKAIGLPVYKDYTFVIDYQRLDKNLNNLGSSSVLSKSPTGGQGAFLSNHWNNLGTINHCYSFGEDNIVAVDDSERKIYYQSKYSNQGISINAGSGTDGSNMWLGIIRDNDTRLFNGAIYSLMSFPYSMSEFLIERQLKKHKLGTLYPDMVEFRPIVKSNLPYSSISYSVNPGEYISVGSTVTITVTLLKTSDKLMEVSCNAISDISISDDNGVYEITGKVVNSPQKINIVISSYLTMLSNSTLISNETLIKNE